MRQQMLLAVLMVGLCARANADVLCKKPNGALFLRAQCKGKEVQLDPAALGPGPLRLLAAVSPQHEVETTSATFQEISDTSVAFTTMGDNRCVLAQLTAFSRGDFGNVEIRLLLDGQVMGGIPVARFGGGTPTPGAFTYVQCDVPKGAHEIAVQFRSPNEGFAAAVAERTLIVIEANQPL
jgi:hypothetical protein